MEKSQSLVTPHNERGKGEKKENGGRRLVHGFRSGKNIDSQSEKTSRKFFAFTTTSQIKCGRVLGASSGRVEPK